MREDIPPPPRDLQNNPDLMNAWQVAQRAGPVHDDVKVLSDSELYAPLPEPTSPRQPAQAIASPDQSSLPSILGYQVISWVGAGGQGSVYKAIHRSTRQVTAIKLLDRRIVYDSARRRRFDRELETLSRIRHANVVRINDVGKTDNDTMYVAMPFIEGQRLDEYVQAAGGIAVSLQPIVKVFTKLLTALQAVHDAGVIHRDLKPSNIVVDRWGEPHILDFGLARLMSADSEHQDLTKSGQLIGTLAWSSPEQARGRHWEIDHRSDIYAVGLMLYQALAGKLPHGAEEELKYVLDSIIDREPTPPFDRQSAVPETLRNSLNSVVLRALAKSPAVRWQSATEMLDALSSAMQGGAIPPPPSRRRRNRLIALVLGGSLSAIIAAYTLHAVLNDPADKRITPLTMPTLDGPYELKMVQIPAGTFLRGSTMTEEGRSANEAMRQTFVASFYISTIEITRGLYRRVMIDPHAGKAADDDLPMAGVTYHDASEFCRRLSMGTKLTFRLPTEDEWEWACRAGDETPYSGTRDVRSMGWYQGNATSLQPAGRKSPNWWGLFDMHGNAREWTSSVYEVGHPPNTASATRPYVVRGGSFKSTAADCRSAAKKAFFPDESWDDIGFRVVATETPERS